MPYADFSQLPSSFYRVHHCISQTFLNNGICFPPLLFKSLTPDEESQILVFLPGIMIFFRYCHISKKDDILEKVRAMLAVVIAWFTFSSVFRVFEKISSYAG